MRQDIQETFDKVVNYIQAKGEADYNSCYVLYDLANTAINKERCVEDGKEILRYARAQIEKVIYPDASDDVTRVRECWRIADNCRDNDLVVPEVTLYMDILLLLAQNEDFDSYLLYLEYKRQQKDRFYLPKRKHFIKHGIIPAMQDMIDDKLDILAISMPPGTQKAQPLYSKVLTPKGFITMGEVKVGTKVISGTGNVCDVTGVFPQGVKPIYELTLDDGSKCRCSDEHLWTVQTRDDRNRKKYRTIPLKNMLGNIRVENNKRLNYSIDYVQPIEFSRRKFYIHPYVMGVLLGDGGLTGGNIRVSSPDFEVLYLTNALLPNGYHLKYVAGYDYTVTGKVQSNYGNCGRFTAELKKYGLHKKHSYEKHIPKEYLYACIEQRLWLLRGLMDTDGHASRSGCEYATSSLQLAEDVRELVHSLGGYCSVVKRKSGYRKDGEYRQCRDSYNLTIQFAADSEKIFCMDRKNDRYQPKRKEIKRFIKDIQYIGDEECQCIYVDDPSHLYITDNYIITHNTTCLKFFNSAVIGWDVRKFNLFFSHSADITRMYYDGVLNICTDNQEYAWSEIFPGLFINQTNAKMGQFNVGSYKPFPSLQTTSRDASNAGKIRANNYLFLDDLIAKQEEALNIKFLDKLWANTYNVDAKQRMLDGCKEIHISTRWSIHDVVGRLQRLYENSNTMRTRFIAIPDIDEETGKSNFDYEYMGFSVEFFNNIALGMDDISYRALYKSQPIEREGLLYHDEDLRRFLSMPDKEPDAILAVCDVKNKGIDFMFLPVMYQYGEDFYLADCVCDDDSDYERQYEKLKNILVNYKVQSCEFESNTGGDRVAFEVQDRVNKAGGSCSITTHPTETNKETRIIVNAEWVKKHVVFRDKSLYSPKEDYGIMMNWLLCYSTVGKNVHDDVPDGLANFRLYVTGMQPQLANVSAVFNPFRSKGYY